MDKFKELVISFFRRMNASCVESDEYIIIDDVEKKFQEKYGKSAPYKISFSEKDSNETLIDCFFPGTKLFKTIMNSLNDGTSTTILKINFNIDPLKEVGEKISLKNCRLKDITHEYTNNFFSRFTFKTILIYLNKNEEISQEIFVHENKIILGDLKDYETSDGDLKEIDAKYMEKDYNLAKSKIREIIQPKIQEISCEISKKLEFEVQRIKEHYLVRKNELKNAFEKNQKRLMEIEKDKDCPEKHEKINRLKKVDQRTLEEEKQKLDREEEFTINDEKQKYAVNMDTKLANTTVIYYPLYKLNLILEDGPIKKNIQLTYDPLKKEVIDSICFNCRKKMKEIALCKNGHACCPNCLHRCINCGQQFCENCLNDKCAACGGPICADCKVHCKKCKKIYCKQHIREDSFSGEEYCTDCLDFCSECMKSTLKENLNESSPGKKICTRCQSSNKKDKILKEIFKNE